MALGRSSRGGGGRAGWVRGAVPVREGPGGAGGAATEAVSPRAVAAPGMTFTPRPGWADFDLRPLPIVGMDRSIPGSTGGVEVDGVSRGCEETGFIVERLRKAVSLSGRRNWFY